MKLVRLETLERKRWLDPLLLDADPSMDMILRYLERGHVYALTHGDALLAEMVLLPLDEKGGEVELKNLAVAPEFQGRGLGRFLILRAFELCREDFGAMLVGTSSQGTGFYRKCGFEYSHTVRDFFSTNYPEPIFENGEQCKHMVYLRKNLSK